MIKVLNVCSDSNIGGAGKCILCFCEKFDRSRFEMLLALPKGSLLVSEVEKLGVRVHLMNIEPDRSYDKSAVKKFVKLFRRIKPDVVHTHASMSARIAARKCKIPLVYTRHSVFAQPKSKTSWFGKLLNGMINNLNADRVIAVAEAARQNLIDTGVSDKKITVVLNGVAPLMPMGADQIIKVRRQYGIKDDEKVVAIVARLNEVKGHKYFIDAAEIVLKRGIRAKFLIVGNGDEEDAIAAYIKEKGLEENIIMTGFVKDVTSVMNLLDVQVNCSFGTEATSISLLEGMSLGKPAVVTDFGGNSGVISNGENGLIVSVKNAMETANAVIRLLEEKDLYEKMVCRALEIYSTTFTAEAMTAQIENIYTEMMEEK